ncbi:hypothetical protein GCM10010149_89390 [Nonomuraea roseoviolacea subsp. roseoviolacea]|uniref:hypothetical protein n=1 Tax=Nonomuraea roseoviolacea TaxID=103837 RepID=UPI0031E1FC1D
MAISPDSQWSFLQDYGVGPGFVPAGSVVVVTGVYPSGTPGIGYSDENTVVADLARPDAAPQTLAIPESDFTALTKAVS